jgi:hypothetical protein
MSLVIAPATSGWSALVTSLPLDCCVVQHGIARSWTKVDRRHRYGLGLTATFENRHFELFPTVRILNTVLHHLTFFWSKSPQNKLFSIYTMRREAFPAMIIFVHCLFQCMRENNYCPWRAVDGSGAGQRRFLLTFVDRRSLLRRTNVNFVTVVAYYLLLDPCQKPRGRTHARRFQ